MLGFNSKGVAMGAGKYLFSSLALGQSHHFGASQERKGTDLLEQVQLEDEMG